MKKKLTVIAERCSGCRICELVCAIKHFSVNNPKKSAIRVMVAYPHPVIRMPVVCNQCGDPKCMDNCPMKAITKNNGVVEINQEKCIACTKCVMACPFGCIFVHDDVRTPFKCDLCSGDPACVKACPKKAILFIPEHMLGQPQRMANLLKYVHMKEVEYEEKGERKIIKYAEIERRRNED